MSKRSSLAAAVAAAALHDVQRHKHNETTVVDPDAFTPPPPMTDSDDDADNSDAVSQNALSEHVTTHQSRVFTAADLASLPAIDFRSAIARPQTARTSIGGYVHRHRTTIHIQPAANAAAATEVFCSAFSDDGTLIAVGCGDGIVRVFSVSNGALAYVLPSTNREALPITSIRFRRRTDGLSNALIVASADGSVSHVHVSSGRVLHAVNEADNQIYALAHSSAMQHFATAGRDAAVRVYDDATKQNVVTFHSSRRLSGAGVNAVSGHSGRVYSVKFHPTAPHTLVSGGWDNTVITWDQRSGGVAAHIFGPHICGDGIDISARTGEMCTASWRPTAALERWDARGRPVPTSDTSGLAMLYTAAYSPDGHWLSVGSGGSNEARLMRTADNDGRNGADIDWADRVSLNGAVYSVAFSADSKRLAVGGNDSNLTAVDLETVSGK